MAPGLITAFTLGVVVHELDIPPLPAEVWGAVALTVAGWVAWMFTRAERTADRRVDALEGAVRHLTERVDSLEAARDEVEAERDAAEAEAHRLRLVVFRLEEYATRLLAWGLGLRSRVPDGEEPPEAPSD